MACVGTPARLRESAWLFPPARDALPLVLVRLEEVIEEPGWVVILDKCDRPQAQARRWYAEEAEARAAVAAIYALGECRGQWRIRRQEIYRCLATAAG